MLFHSFQYLIFLPIVLVVYWVCPKKWRVYPLLIASYYFYMSWDARYVVLILFTTVVSYFAARFLEKTEKKSAKKWILAGAAVLVFAVLFVFKYLTFFFDVLNGVFALFKINLSPVTLTLILPVGISFYTFQTVSYVVDVYRGKVPAEKNIAYYATFVSFFPQLVAGPIERTENLLPQIKAVHKFNSEKALAGLKLMLIGYFKKLVIADNIALYVDTVYGDPSKFQGIDVLLVILLFSFQIYGDFSGYSDIAVGTAKLLDIDLMTNFKSPYYSSSIREFWSRWHISLSTWFRDYLYIPLGGNRRGKFRQVLNTMITFTVSGLWHGANFTFLVWGALHGLLDSIELLLRKPLEKARKNGIFRVFATIFVFLIVSFLWVVFRANSLPEAWLLMKNAFAGIGSIGNYFTSLSVIAPASLLMMAIYLAILAVYDFLCYREAKIVVSREKYKVLRWAFFLIVALLIIFASPKGTPAEFVYFQF